MSPTKPSERLLKYPPMERQDLNQTQLGSFKFTPVDSVPGISVIASRYMSRQLADSILQLTSSRRPLPSSSERSRDLIAVKPTHSDADFFNHHIKPDIGDSRLRLGPAALRSAVEGAATSPCKKDRVRIDRNTVDSALDRHRHSGSHDISAFPNYAPDMNPAATAFVPGGDVPAPSLQCPEPGIINESLCQALVNEKQAHSATKVALHQEVERCRALEEQIRNQMTQISSLTVTVNNLGSIIRHSFDKGASSIGPSHVQAVPYFDAEEAELNEYYRKHTRLNKNPDKTTRGPAKSVQEVPPVQGQLNEEKAATGEASWKFDDAQLFNLELLKDPKFDNSPSSALRRTLRKHFAIANDDEEVSRPSTPVKPTRRGDQLIDISPDSETDVESRRYYAKNAADLQRHPALTVSGTAAKESQWQTKPEVLMMQGKIPEPIQAGTGSLIFGSRKGVLQTKAGGKDTGSGCPDTMCDPATGERKSDSSSQPDVQDSDAAETNSRTAVASSASGQLVKSVTVKVGTDLTGEPKWLVNGENPIFKDQDSLWASVAGAGPEWLSTSQFPAHPVRYLPESAASDTNAYRTVMVDNIPVGSSVKDVLAVVRGGSLESIQLFPPIGRATSFMTARVVFNHEIAANEMYHRQEQKHFEVDNAVVRVWKPTDPTYPSNDALTKGIFGPEQASRILLVGNIHPALFEILPEKMVRFRCKNDVIGYSWTCDGYASIEFTSVQTAMRIMGALKTDLDFSGADFCYDQDYTSAPYA